MKVIATLMAVLALSSTVAVNATYIQPNYNLNPGNDNKCVKDAKEFFGENAININSNPFAFIVKSYTIPYQKINHEDDNVQDIYIGLKFGSAGSPLTFKVVTPKDNVDGTETTVDVEVKQTYVATLPATVNGSQATTLQKITLPVGSLRMNPGDYLTVTAGGNVIFGATCRPTDLTKSNADNDKADFQYMWNLTGGNSFKTSKTLLSQGIAELTCSQGKYITPTFGFQLRECPSSSSSSTGVTESSSSSSSGGQITGDPIFEGFHGQSYQVHGYAGAAFNLITHADVQMNARFEIIPSGRIDQEIKPIREANSALPHTPSWTHSGTYLGEIAFETNGNKVFVKAGQYEAGITEASVQSSTGSNVVLSVGDRFDLSADKTQYVQRVSSHAVVIVTDAIQTKLVNSDMFFNIESVSLGSSVTASSVSGLLGESANPTFKSFTPSQVLSYLISSPRDETFSEHQSHNKAELFQREFGQNKYFK